MPILHQYTPDEYLALERESDARHEYLLGQIYDMAGESLAHSQICMNLAIEVGSQLRGRDCQALSPNMKVRTSDSVLFSYPDLSVVCGQPIFHDRYRDVLLNPKIVFEVLSPSTEAYDRGEKFSRHGRYIDSLSDYLLVSQHRPVVNHYVRQPDGQWLYSEIEGLPEKLIIASIQCVVKMSAIYDRVAFP
ncbi:MAG TPA: Uma2 family endonuclease [Blastocatellia bacterium]